MSLCVHCGQPVLERGGLCTYHLTGHCDDWATGNRIMCDFLHRGIELPGPCVPAGHSIGALVDELGAASSA